MRCSSRTAFTLIELLVVVAIIGIIAAILFPTFAGAREKARQAGCESNLKQIGLAWLMYAQDYDEVNVINNYSTSSQYTMTWYGLVNPSNVIDPTQGLLGPYTTHNVQIENCPSANLQPNFFGPGGTFGYGLNEYIYPQQFNLSATQAAQNQAISLAQVSAPSDTIITADTALYFFGQLYANLQLFAPGDQAFGVPTTHALHQNRADVLWFDGHVKPMSLTYMNVSDLGGDTPATLQANNLGYIIKQGCAFGDSTCQDYYYQITKP